jgi:DNA adenine methylase
MAIADKFHERIWINDLDRGLYALWLAYQRHPERLKEEVKSFAPSVDEFLRWKEYFLSHRPLPGDEAGLVAVACGRLALQQITFGAFGTMAGAPRGGGKQDNGGIDTRWKPDSICRKIEIITQLLEHARITSLDFAAVIGDQTERAAIYCDPPYVAAGPALYQHSFTEAEHVRLRDLLRHTEHRWLLSYDDHALIWDLYSEFTIIERVPMRYCAARKIEKYELLIRPRS